MALDYQKYTKGRGQFPVFPTHFPHGITEDRLDALIENLVDRCDKAYLTTDATLDEYNEWNIALNTWARTMRGTVMQGQPYVTNAKPPFDIFFVLNGLQDGEEGVRAVTCAGRQLKDGWYYLLNVEDDEDGSGPFISRDECKREATRMVK